MADDAALQRLALAVLLRTVQDAQAARRRPDWASPEDVTEARTFDRCPTFFLWCRAAKANPTTVRNHVRACLPVAEPAAIKVRQTGRLRALTEAQRHERSVKGRQAQLAQAA
jgi:hypothetical protein